MSSPDERGAGRSALKIPAGEVTIAADAFGDPADPPVVLLHGGGRVHDRPGRGGLRLAGGGRRRGRCLPAAPPPPAQPRGSWPAARPRSNTPGQPRTAGGRLPVVALR